MALGYGSCLLPFRLPSLYSRANRFSVRSKQEVLSGLAGPNPLPVSAWPFRVFECESKPLVRLSHQPCLHVLVPVAIVTLSVTGFNRPAETKGQSDRNTDRGQFLFHGRHRPHRSPPHPPIASRTGATPHGKMGEICLPKTTEAVSARGRVPAVPDLYCRFRRLSRENRL